MDIEKSYQKFRLHQKSSNRKYADENAGFEYWVLNDIENNRNIIEKEAEEKYYYVSRKAFHP